MQPNHRTNTPPTAALKLLGCVYFLLNIKSLMSFLSFSDPAVTLLMAFFLSSSLAVGLKYCHAGM